MNLLYFTFFFNLSFLKTDINDCVNQSCGNGSCVDGVNSYTCNCSLGFTGDHCETGRLLLVLFGRKYKENIIFVVVVVFAILHLNC